MCGQAHAVSQYHGFLQRYASHRNTAIHITAWSPLRQRRLSRIPGMQSIASEIQDDQSEGGKANRQSAVYMLLKKTLTNSRFKIKQTYTYIGPYIQGHDSSHPTDLVVQ